MIVITLMADPLVVQAIELAFFTDLLQCSFSVVDVK